MKFHQLSKPTISETAGWKSFTLGINYPKRRLIAFEGEPKTGKSLCCIQDAIMLAQTNDVLYIYNEATEETFMTFAWNVFNNLKNMYPNLDEDLLSLDFLELNSDENVNIFTLPANANRTTVNVFTKKVSDLIAGWISKKNDPALIVIDSITQFCNDAPAQTGTFVKQLYYLLHSLLHKTNKTPTIICINQMVDGRAYGGFKVAHAYDGIVSFHRYRVDKFTQKVFNRKIGDVIYTYSIEGIRGVLMDMSETVLVNNCGVISPGQKLEDAVSIDI